MKFEVGYSEDAGLKSRSREGAWIEIAYYVRECVYCLVAPVRERGLKYFFTLPPLSSARRRSREGAWIEMLTRAAIRPPSRSLP